MGISMIVSDLDGTLFNSDQEGYEISSQLVEEIKLLKKNGKIFTIATGRPEVTSKEVIRSLGIDAPYIVSNGSEIIDGHGRRIYSNTFSLETWLPSLEMFRQMGCTIIIPYGGEVFCLEHTKRIPIYEKKELVECKVLDSELMESKLEVNKILVIGNVEKSKEIWNKLEESLSSEFRYIISEDDYFEITKKDVSKGNALKYLKEYLNLRDEEVVAIGNHLNDKELIEEAHIGVAVGNAVEGLKEIADYVTIGEYEKGVIEAIQKFL